MSTWSDLKDALMMKQHDGYKAIYNGEMIHGCGDCGNNSSIPSVIPWAPTHKCMLLTDETGAFKTIFNPFDILKECPLAIRKVEQEQPDEKPA